MLDFIAAAFALFRFCSAVYLIGIIFMKKIKFLGFLTSALLCVSFAAAQDFSSDFDFSDSSSSGDFGGDFGNDFSGDFGSTSSSSSFSGFSSSALEVCCEAEVNLRG